MSSLISVLMPVYNSELYIDESIRSIRAQTYTNYEFIIVDDGSTDKSSYIIKKHAEVDKRIKYFHQDNQGISYTRNRLLKLAKGAYIAWMDSDDISLPERLKTQLNFLQANNDYVAVGLATTLIDMDGDIICSWKMPLNHAEIDSLHINGKGGGIIFPSSMMLTSAVKAVNGFDTNIIGAEDLALFLRLAEIGKIGNLKENLFLYRQHINSICHTKKNEITSNNAEVIAIAKARRGLSINKLDSYLVNDMPHQVYYKWACWAYSDKNFDTAWKYSKKSLLIKPFDLNIIKLFLHTFYKKGLVNFH